MAGTRIEGTNRLSTELLGRRVELTYSETWLGNAILALRLVMGWVFLQAGLTKLFDPSWTAAGFLQNAVPEGNPLMGVWTGMAGSPIVDGMVIWGFTLIGVALLLGILVRWSAFWGAVMMLLMWAASLEGGLLAGLPLAHGWVVDDHIVYALLLFGLGAVGAGRILGVDSWLEDTILVKRFPRLRYLLG